VAAAANRIEVERTDDGAILRLVGEHDLSSAAEVTKALDGLISERQPLVIDLAPATFIDSSILAALLEARERSRSEGIGLTLSVPPETAAAVRRIVEITGLEAAVPTSESAAETVAGEGDS
jgi:anti-anti-sigma factor